MKIALVHDYIKEYGGAERVLEALHEIWPNAPVYTTVYLPEFLGPHKERFKNWDIRTSWLQHVPFKEKLISPFRIIAPFIFRGFEFSDFDVVIVSATGAYSPNGLKIKNTTQNSKMENGKRKTEDNRPLQICYCHTPPRYLYGYATAREWKKNFIFRVFGEIANHFLRLVDFRSSQNVDYFIANSLNVKSRIQKFYRRDSVVIYPPVEIEKDTKILRYKDIKKVNYFLAGGRLARPKHIDLIVQTFEKLNLSLKVFGRSFGDAPNILVSQYPNISSLGEVSDEDKLELMRNAKAYIFAAEDEDFGITPVEAMSVGTPVIAYRSGGVVESVIDGKTGVFFDKLAIDSLIDVIEHFNDLNHLIKREDCIRQAKKFSKERFKREIKQFVRRRLGQ